jgi:predicted RNase H-like HicB family nuclease
MRQVILYTDEDGIWIADVPSLPGCHSDGKTKEEALLNVREAIELYIELYIQTLIDQGQPVPHDKLNALVVVLEESPLVSN